MLNPMCNMNDAHRKMGQLSDELRQLINAMSEGQTESALIALIVIMEQEQRRHSQSCEKVQKQVEEDLKILIGPDLEKKEPEKKSPETTEKKTSRLHGLPNLQHESISVSLAFAAPPEIMAVIFAPHVTAGDFPAKQRRGADFYLGLTLALC